MHFLLLNQFFPPDPVPTGRLLADVAHALAARGHRVTVVCARAGPADPDPQLTPGLRIIRARSAPFRHATAARLLSYLSYAFAAFWHGLRVPRPDVVLTLTTPPLLCLVGAVLRKVRRTRHYIWEMDVYPDIAVALGVLAPDARFTRLAADLADRCRRRAEAVIALGPCMVDRLTAHRLGDRVRIAENWADGDRIRPCLFPPPDPLVLLYSGNLGLAHDTDTVVQAMKLLKDDARFQFVFAGGGPRRRPLEDLCRHEGIRHVAFSGYQPDADLPLRLAACHIGLVTQTPASLGAVVPSKTYSLMAAGRPILFIGPRAAGPARLVEQLRCGWHVEPGDAAWLVKLLRGLAADFDLIRHAGARGRLAFDGRYDTPTGVARILEILGLPADAAKTHFDQTNPIPETDTACRR